MTSQAREGDCRTSQGCRGIRRLRWRHALTYMFGSADCRRSMRLGGLLMLACPPLGWHLAMGYRRAVGLAARSGSDATFPSVARDWRALLLGGVGTTGVILAYLLPALVTFFVGVVSLSAVREHPGSTALVIAAILLLPPLAIPSLAFAATTLGDGSGGSAPWLLASGVLGATAVAILPAAFLNVSDSGRLASAFRLDQAVAFMLHHARLYLEAWLLSVVATAAAFATGPLMPWALFWSYLAILSAFNQALVHSGRSRFQHRLHESVLVCPGPVQGASQSDGMTFRPSGSETP